MANFNPNFKSGNQTNPQFKSLSVGNPRTYQPLIYPRGTPRSKSDHIRFKSVTYPEGGVGNTGGISKNSRRIHRSRGFEGYHHYHINGSATLYMPESLDISYKANWGGEEFKKTAISSGSWTNIFETAFRKGWDTVAGTVREGSSAAAAARKRGEVINPNIEFLFQNIDARTFSFTFHFSPESRKESENIQQIIMYFKQKMHPRLGNASGAIGKYYKFPDIFQISIHNSSDGNQINPFYFKMKDSALTDCAVSYGGTGAYASFENASPTKIQLTLTFQELVTLSQEDFKSFGDSY